MALLSVHLLGRFQIKLAESEIDGFSTDKTRALLAFLAAESDRPHRRQALAGLLWPNYPERAARTSLRSALVNLRQVIGDHRAEPPFLLISRQSIAINLESDIWVDVAVFRRLLDLHQISRLSISQLEEAVNLYQGRFLEGFSLADSAPFDDWVLITREQLNLRLIAALERLTAVYQGLGDRQKALFYARRWVELEPWQGPAQRQLMQLLAESGHHADALAQYKGFRQILADELGVEPEKATTRLFQEIRDRKVHEGSFPPSLSLDVSSALPSFLEADSEVEMDQPVFIGREYELSVLFSQLEEVLDGQGKVVFVVGGAGRGKTFLLEEFIRQALSEHPIPVVKGYCNAYSGGGDPYLPFRQVLDMLTGDVEAMWSAGWITREHAMILWKTLPVTSKAIVDAGPDLIETFLPGPSLLARTAAAVNMDAPWLSRLSRLVSARIASKNPSDLDQHTLIEHYAQVLEAAAQKTPLVIILEDLHWADRGSIDLLLHIGRRLARSRILLIGAFRPDELAVREDGNPHPVGELVAELRSLHGEIIIDLAVVDQAAGQQFVNDLLDVEPNRFSRSFRRALHNRTLGHPLFTVETLRMLKEQGGLVKDPEGRWIEGQMLDWDHVPPRVEAVIQKRVARLEPSLYELLTVASVEGEEFSAEIVSRVLDMSELQVLHTLTHNLGQRHRLLQDRGEFKSTRQTVSRYRFSHQLIQWYIYTSLSTGERRRLHEAVARALENLFADDIETVTIQLAYHYSLTDVKDKTLHHLTQAGHQSKKRYDGQQADYYFTKALSIETGNTADRFHLLAARAAVFGILAQREAQKADIDAMLTLAVDIANRALQCDALLALADFYLQTEIFHAREPAQKACLMAQEIGDSVREAHALRRLSWEGRLGADYQTSRVYLEEAAARFKQAELPGEAAACLFMLARRLPASAKHVFELELAEQAMTLSHESGDYRLQAIAHKNLAIAYTYLAKDAHALPLVEEALAMQRDLGDLHEQCSTLDVRGVVLARLHRREEAAAMFHRCLELSEDISSDWGILGAVFGYWNYCYIPDGEYEQCLAFIDERLNYALANQRDWLVGFLSWMKAKCLTDVGQYENAHSLSQTAAYQVTEDDLVSHVAVVMLAGSIKGKLGYYIEARQDLEKALVLAEDISDRYTISWPLIDLANLALQMGDQASVSKGLEQAEIAVQVTREANEEIGLAEALDMCAQLELALGLPEKALEYSSQVIQLMESNPWLPKPQNHLFTHALALRKLGRHTEAKDYLERAYQRVIFVADKLTDQSLRQGWLQNVHVNREIVRLRVKTHSDMNR